MIRSRSAAGPTVCPFFRATLTGSILAWKRGIDNYILAASCTYDRIPRCSATLSGGRYPGRGAHSSPAPELLLRLSLTYVHTSLSVSKSIACCAGNSSDHHTPEGIH